MSDVSGAPEAAPSEELERLERISENIGSEWASPETPFLGDFESSPAAQDERFYSVTTIINCLEKPALLYWAAEETAKAALRVRGTLSARVQEDGEDEVIKWLKNARFRPMKGQRTATALGSAVHDACEEYALTGTRPVVDAEVAPFLDRFDEWAQLWQPRFLAAEAAVYNRTYGYAGTLDFIAELEGRVVIGDYKTSRRSMGSDDKPSHPYPEVALQLAAYRYSELVATWRARRHTYNRRRYYLLSTAERELGSPMADQAIEGAVCLHLTPEHATLHAINTSEEVWTFFLYVIEAFRWLNGPAKSAVGAPLKKQQQKGTR